MPAGGPGDEPIVDILRWRRPVYSPAVDSLIAELVELWGGLNVEGYLKEHRILRVKPSGPQLAAAEELLAAKRNELYRSARTNGWDMQSLDARLQAQRQAVDDAWARGSNES
jgi:hypothetical protein